MSIPHEHLEILDGTEAAAISLLTNEDADEILRCVAALRLKSATSEQGFQALLSVAKNPDNSRRLDMRVGWAFCLVVFALRAQDRVIKSELNSYNARNFDSLFYSPYEGLGFGLDQERYDRSMKDEWRKDL